MNYANKQVIYTIVGICFFIIATIFMPRLKSVWLRILLATPSIIIVIYCAFKSMEAESDYREEKRKYQTKIEDLEVALKQAKCDLKTAQMKISQIVNIKDDIVNIDRAIDLFYSKGCSWRDIQKSIGSLNTKIDMCRYYFNDDENASLQQLQMKYAECVVFNNFTFRGICWHFLVTQFADFTNEEDRKRWGSLFYFNLAIDTCNVKDKKDIEELNAAAKDIEDDPNEYNIVLQAMAKYAIDKYQNKVKKAA